MLGVVADGSGSRGPAAAGGYRRAVADQAPDRDSYAGLLADLDHPMVVVTASSAGERAGCLVGFAAPASIEPPRFCIFLSKRNRTFRVAERVDTLVVHVLPEDAEDLARLFGGESGDDTDKFERCDWKEGPGGAPILERCTGWFAGSVLERWDAGDHVGFLLEPGRAERRESVP